ncbi:MAG: hypothetical protein JF616_22775, partial [Fibrobacteres bacterium]|nr:hypothetical protein [Fibrobacterota bacterium]
MARGSGSPISEAAQRSSAHGRRLKFLGAALFWPGVALLPATAGLGRVMGFAVFGVFVVALALIFAGLALMRRGRKLTTGSGDAVLAGDPRPPVVYLRPFDSDTLGVSVVTRSLGWRYYTDEEQLATVVQEIGPFIAIGDPREKVASLGAARIYAREGGWEGKVLELVAKARLIILRAGTSEGFWYEFQAVLTSTSPAQVLLLTPARRSDYESFRKRALRIHGRPLPDWADVGKHKLLSNAGAIIEFDDDWTPRTLRVIKSMTRTPWTAPQVARLKLTLQPVFERLGVQYTPPPVRRARMIFIVVAFAITAFAFNFMILLNPPGWITDLFESHDEYVSRDPVAGPPPEPVVETPVASAYDTAVSNLQARLKETPGFRAALARPTTPEQARSMGSDLSARGMRRLGDERLLERAAIIDRLAGVADVDTCAALLTGIRSNGMEAALRRLDDADVTAFFDIVGDAMVAELGQQPAPPTPPQDEVTSAMRALFQTMSADDVRPIVDTFGNPRGVTNDVACQATRALFSHLPAVAATSRAVIVRALVS